MSSAACVPTLPNLIAAFSPDASLCRNKLVTFPAWTKEHLSHSHLRSYQNQTKHSFQATRPNWACQKYPNTSLASSSSANNIMEYLLGARKGARVLALLHTHWLGCRGPLGHIRSRHGTLERQQLAQCSPLSSSCPAARPPCPVQASSTGPLRVRTLSCAPCARQNCCPASLHWPPWCCRRACSQKRLARSHERLVRSLLLHCSQQAPHQPLFRSQVPSLGSAPCPPTAFPEAQPRRPWLPGT